MKRKKKHAWVALLLMLGACQDAELKRHLLREWRYDLEAIRQEMQQREVGFAEQSYMESIMSSLQYARLHFQQGGALEFRLDSLVQAGTWKLRKQGREISIRLAEEAQVYKLTIAGSDTLTLEPVGGPGLPFPRVLTKP